MDRESEKESNIIMCLKLQCPMYNVFISMYVYIYIYDYVYIMKDVIILIDKEKPNTDGLFFRRAFYIHRI